MNVLRIFHRESKTIIGAATIVGVLSFVSRLVGLVRDRILAGQFGAGDTLDIYYTAFKLPDLLFSLIVVGALSASFIPLFLKHRSKLMGQDEAWRFTNNTLHLLGAAIIVFSIVLALTADPIAQLLAPGFADFKQTQVVQFMRVMFIAQIVLAISMIYGSVLQSLKRFLLYSLAPIFYNFGIILGAFWFVDFLGPIGLAWGVVFGAVLHLLVQIVGVWEAGYRYKFIFKPRDKDTRSVLKLMGPRALGLAVNQILFVGLAIMATTLAVGSVTIFQFAYNIQFFPVGIIGVSFAIAVFPTFSEQVEGGEIKAFIKTFSRTARQLLYMLVPLTILFLILRAQIVRVVVGAGAFDWAATISTADTLAFFVLTLIPQAFVFLLARAFFALHDTVTPLTSGLIATLVGILAAFLLIEPFGVIGLGMAYSLSAIVNAVLLWVPLRQRIGSLGEATIVASLIKISGAGLASAVVMQALKPIAVELISLDTFFGVFAQGLIAGGAGLIVYVLASKFFKVEEQSELLSAMHRKFIRKAIPEETISSN